MKNKELILLKCGECEAEWYMKYLAAFLKCPGCGIDLVWGVG